MITTERDTEAITKRAIKFLTGDCFGGKLAQGMNSLLCSAILYALLMWAFLGENSAWATFKRLEKNYDIVANAITSNAEYSREVAANTDRRFSNAFKELAQHDDKIQTLDTRVTVLDATTCKIGRRCQ